MQHMKDKTDNNQDNVIPFIPDGDFYFTKGVEAFQRRKFEIAIKWLKKAVDTKPNDPLYQCQMSIIYTEVGAFHAANQLLTKVLQSTGDQYADCYYLLANNYAHLGLLNDARKYATSYLDKEPDGDFTEEAKSLLNLIDIDEEDYDFELESEDELLIFQETVFYHMENKEYDKALPLLEEMITIFPDHQLPKHDYTQALFFSGNEEEAIQMELDMLNEQPDSLYSHINLAIFYYERNQMQEYVPHIQTLLNVYPIHEQQKLKIATTLARTEYYKEAYSRFRMLVKGLISGHLSYYRWYSITAFHLGETSKALALWEEGCKKHPNLSKEDRPWQ
ncbi:tetratricopeptide repeat protein [Virgibacillus byunsanensis]|uniref:Tetratricopeptide repeat protein n=1 Tax=Virgibacillus byunsanensis TaxID=570945 RepID=A0ABW3LKC4_9BACI